MTVMPEILFSFSVYPTSLPTQSPKTQLTTTPATTNKWIRKDCETGCKMYHTGCSNDICECNEQGKVVWCTGATGNGKRKYSIILLSNFVFSVFKIC